LPCRCCWSAVGARRPVHPFPTRRSSDLVGDGRVPRRVHRVADHGALDVDARLLEGDAGGHVVLLDALEGLATGGEEGGGQRGRLDRKSTRLNSSHVNISYAVFCWKKETD